MTQLTHPPPPPPSSPPTVTILILGAGWTSTFLLPLLTRNSIPHAATTRTGHDNTIAFVFNPNNTDISQYKNLPNAKYVLITFPLKGEGQSKLLTKLYAETHPKAEEEGEGVRWIQLGSTGIFTAKGWNDERSAYDNSNPRAIAEDELLSLLGNRACVLNLAGLYGHDRQPRNWVGRVARSKEDVRGKGGVHFVSGGDVARGVLLVIGSGQGEKEGGWEEVKGRRWIVCDLRCYDWWELILGWGGGGGGRGKGNEGGGGGGKGEEGEGEGEGEGRQYRKWVVELMREEGVRALPRDGGELGRRLDGRGFWEAVGGWPVEGRLC